MVDAALALPPVADLALGPPLAEAFSSFSLLAWLAFAAAVKASFLSSRGAAVRRVPSLPGSPRNFCQSPVTLSRTRTGSVGWAPTDSQCWTRSEFTSMREGSAFG